MNRLLQFLALLRAIFLHNFLLKLLAVVVAVGLWFFVNAAERDAEATVAVGLRLENIPQDVMLVSPRIEMIELRVLGPRTLLSRIDERQMSVTLDLTRVKAGSTTFRMRDNQLALPRGVTVVRMMPSEITLEFARVERKSVPLHLSVEKPPAGDLRIVESSLHPERVEISGPARDVGELATVETEALDLSEETAGLVERELGLQLPSEHLSSSSATVKVQIRLAEPEDTRTLMDVPIVVRNTSRPTSIVPEHVDVATRGPKSKIESLELSHGAVYIDATDYVPGVYDIVPAVALPPEFSLVVKLQAVKLTVMEAIPAVETPIPQTPSLPTANAGGEEQ